MTPFDIYLAFVGAFFLCIGTFSKVDKDDEAKKSFAGGLMVLGIIVLGIAMWRIS